MSDLTYVLVNGDRFAAYTTLTNAAGLVDKINRTYEGKPARLDLGETGPMLNPKHVDALTVLDTMDGMTRKPVSVKAAA